MAESLAPQPRRRLEGADLTTTLAAVLAAAAVAALLVDLTLDFGRSAQMHAWCANRLWLIREDTACAPFRFGGWRARHRGRASPPRCLDARAARDLRERAARRCASLPDRGPGDRHGGRSRLSDEEIEMFNRKSSRLKWSSEAA